MYLQHWASANGNDIFTTLKENPLDMKTKSLGSNNFESHKHFGKKALWDWMFSLKWCHFVFSFLWCMPAVLGFFLWCSSLWWGQVRWSPSHLSYMVTAGLVIHANVHTCLHAMFCMYTKHTLYLSAQTCTHVSRVSYRGGRGTGISPPPTEVPRIRF